ncbi:MAG TPA: HPF/RaiA family ribosome-associated protein [Candidatus Babeliales bacterium]|nr:HPF/RaiA family ribosome-associated protein [Candidatus Babeliales bacterium]
MNTRIVFRNMDHSDVMEAYANDQLEKVIKFLENDRGPVFINLYFEPSHVHEHHRVELHVKSAEYDLNSSYEHEGMNFYDTLDRVIDVMYRELHEKKRRNHDEEKMRGRHEEVKKQR